MKYEEDSKFIEIFLRNFTLIVLVVVVVVVVVGGGGGVFKYQNIDY